MFKIISDTACDYSIDYAKSVDVDLVPLYVTFDGTTYLKDKEELPIETFYDKILNENLFPKTSLPGVQDYIDKFLPYIKNNQPVICITISTILSGSYNSAVMAKDYILDEYPDAKIEIINSLVDTAAQALIVREAVRIRNAGFSFEKAVELLNKIILSSTIFFTIGSLDYLKKGGRIGRLATKLTEALNIRPIIYLQLGELNIGGIARTRNKSKKIVLDVLKKYFTKNKLDINDYVFTAESCTDFDELKDFRKDFENTFNVKCVESYEDFNIRIGSVTACHTGPYAIGIGIVPKYEKYL